VSSPTAIASDKQGLERSPILGRIRQWNRARSLDLKGKVGRRTLATPDPALISDGSLRRKFNPCNNYISVIRLFIRNSQVSANLMSLENMKGNQT
jgi:hypothetical protein